LRAKAEAASNLQDDSDVDQSVPADAVTSSAGARGASTSSTPAAAASYGTIPNGLPSGNATTFKGVYYKRSSLCYGCLLYVCLSVCQ